MAFRWEKLRQLWRLVRESHAQPLAGEPQAVPTLGEGESAVTFIGHSSFLVRMEGRGLLIDPVFATRLILLRRQRRAGVRVRDLPTIDAILLTHAHMDHLDKRSLRAVLREMRRRGRPAPVAVVPEGVEDLVHGMGFRQVLALRWWQAVDVAGLQVTATPARHWGARMFSDTHRGFGGYVVASPDGVSVYHSGDSAYFKGFAEIGMRLRPQVALLPIGAYFPDSYRGVHTSPEEALQAFVDLGSSVMIPMHYGTFRLGREPMDEPVPRLLKAAEQAGSEAKCTCSLRARRSCFRLCTRRTTAGRACRHPGESPSPEHRTGSCRHPAWSCRSSGRRCSDTPWFPC